jgi:hypothetical protein
MSRIHTITDEDSGIRARVETDGHGVRRIVLEAETHSGLPPALIAALEPYIGLPPVLPAGRRRVADGARDPGEPSPAGKMIAAIRGDGASVTSLNGRRRTRRKGPKPTDGELARVIATLGTTSPTALAAHFGASKATASNWMTAYRKRQAAATTPTTAPTTGEV